MTMISNDTERDVEVFVFAVFGWRYDTVIG